MKEPIPPEVQVAWDRGDQLQAIKRLRESHGLGLAAAKAALEAGALPVRAPAPAGGAGLPSEVLAALASGDKIGAIRRLKESTGLGLKEARDAVEQAEREGLDRLAPWARGLSQREAHREAHREAQRVRGGWLALLAGVVACAVLAWWLLQRA